MKWATGPGFRVMTGIQSASCERLQTAAVELHDLEALRVDAVEAAHVDHHHVVAAASLAVGVRLDAAGGAKWVMDGALVELKIRHGIRARQEPEICAVRG